MRALAGGCRCMKEGHLGEEQCAKQTIERFFMERLATALGSKLRSLVDSLYPLQVLQQLAAHTTQFLPPRPFHSGIPALPAFVQVPGGPLKACIRIEYDDFLLCHAATVPECIHQRNLSRRPGRMVGRAPFEPKIRVFLRLRGVFEQDGRLVPVEN